MAAISHLLYPVSYPKPRPLTEEETCQLRFREDVAREALGEIYQNLRPNQETSSEEASQEWEEVTSYLIHWAREPAREANAHCKIRRSRRTVVQRYRQEVEDFCQNWRLCAWWAVPALVQSHMYRIETAYDQLLELYIRGLGEVKKFTIIGQIPKTTDEDFERDQNRLANTVFETVVGPPDHPIAIQKRPSRTEMADLEKVNTAACVVIDWDGRSHYWSVNSPEQSITVSQYIIQECENRLGRKLTKREERQLLAQIDPQIAKGRQFFLDIGWDTSGAADTFKHAQWVAQKLLNPGRSWEKISGLDADLLPSSIRACHQFARRAMLTLPHR
jgi:hypothetical protein